MKKQKLPQGVHWTYKGREVGIEHDSPLSPRPGELAYELLNRAPLVLSFYHAPWDSGQSRRNPDLGCDLDRRGENNDGRFEISYNLETGKLMLHCYKITKYATTSNTGKITSIPDLQGCVLRIHFDAVYSTALTREATADLKELRDKLQFEYLNLSMSGGRNIRINGHDLRKTANGSDYECTLPDNL
jgi:hypothetical protein